MEKTIILILNKSRIEVEKEKLAKKSHYFASLFAHNFNDSHKKEHVINYDISLRTLQSFVEWIEDNGECTECESHMLRISMTKYVKQNFKQLLNLLQLSVLFTVDELRNDVIELIVSFWLLPDKIIDIWLMAEELNIKILQDISLSVCLDRFEELPLRSLFKLSKENVTLLLQNVNVRSSIEHLMFVRQKWMVQNVITDMPDIKPERQLKYMVGVVVYKTEGESYNKDGYLFTWNNDVFSERTQLTFDQDSEKGIVGMQVVGRGFSVYTVGGEMGLGTGRFNNHIRRYCLLSKKWYHEATLLRPRRHMVVVFIGNKLIIVGGVGRHRLKLDAVDILDIHTGEWERGDRVPECFTEVPPHCVKDGKLFLTKSLLYIYYPQIDYWQTVMVWNIDALSRAGALLAGNATFCLIETISKQTFLLRADILNEPVCKNEDCLKRCAEHNMAPITQTAFEMDSYRLLHVGLSDLGLLLLNDGRDQYLHIHYEMNEDFEGWVIPKSGSFNIIDPNTLYNTV